MSDWQHSPVHRLFEAGTYMVTSGTYQKAPIFRSEAHLRFLHDLLLETARKHHWQLQAWAVFPNHYHFVAISPPNAASLRQLVRELHSVSAREANRWAAEPGRKVWFEYWDSQITFQRSYLARLNYVQQNAVHHRVVRVASQYPWCSAGWFERTASPGFQKTVERFTGQGIKVPDEFDVSADEIR
jgi:putative transposase